MSTVKFFISGSSYTLDHTDNVRAGQRVRNIEFSDKLASAISSIINSYDYSEDVAIVVDPNSISFTSVSSQGVVTLAVTRENVSTFKVTTVNGYVSTTTVDSLDEVCDFEDDFDTIVKEVCKEHFINLV